MKFTVIFTLLLSLGACSMLPNPGDEPSSWTSEKYYKEAKSALNSGDYQTAIEYFEGLQTRFPFGKYAQQALLDIAYAYYRFDEPTSAIATANRFIKIHPRHQHVDYAFYIKGLANFSPSIGPLDDMFNQDLAERDIKPLQQSFRDFSELVKRFPNSRYAEDARQRMIHLRNALSRHELKIAQFYFKQKAYIAVVSRAKYILEHYQGSPSVAPALDLMAKSYGELGLVKMQKDSLRVLNLNYPDFRKKPKNEDSI